ncbi:TPA: hypothetical protein U1W61_001455 [Streptococcus suis]|nr:hypothetical protein [Streptococcus suis]HEM4129738.1 hypothetical protein [Streptococcus suis]
MGDFVTILLFASVIIFRYFIYPKMKKANEEKRWAEEQLKYRITIIDLINERQSFVGTIDSFNDIYNIVYDYNQAHVFSSQEAASKYAYSMARNENISILILAGSNPVEKIC